MSIILIVDDDKNFLLSLVEGLKAHDEEFEIRTAANGKIATQIISDEYVDLVITDLKMPVMDGFELLAYMSSRYARTPVIVMTAYGTPMIENSVSHLGAIRYLEKPLDFDLLVENIYKSVELSKNICIPSIPMISFLKLVQIEKKTCTLTIRNQEHKGKIFFNKGILLDAVSPQGRGETAALEIMGWNQAEIQISSKSSAVAKNINNNLDFLIMVFESRQPKHGSINGDAPSPPNSYDNKLDDIFDVCGDEPALAEIIPKQPHEEAALLTNRIRENPGLLAGKACQDEAQPKPIANDEVGEEDLPKEANLLRERGESILPDDPEEKDVRLLIEENQPEESQISFTDTDPVGVTHGLSQESNVFPNDGDIAGERISGNDNNLLSVSETRQEKKTNHLQGKENDVNVKKINEALNTLKETAGAGLLSCDIFTSRDGQSITGYNSNETFCAMSNQITQYMTNTIKEADFPPMGNTYMIDLAEDKMAIVMIVGDYQWGMLIDTKKCSLGMLLNVALPRAKTVFASAMEN